MALYYEQIYKTNSKEEPSKQIYFSHGDNFLNLTYIEKMKENKIIFSTFWVFLYLLQLLKLILSANLDADILNIFFFTQA